MEMTIAADDEYYALQTDRNRLHGEMEKLQKVNDELLKQYKELKEDNEEAIRNMQSAERQLEHTKRDLEIAQANERGDAGLRHEIDRLRSDLHSRDNEIGHSEGVISKQTKMIEDLTKRVEDLTHKAEEGVRLKDQLDEYKHAADKVQKMENVMEKYKKKLEETADLRRSMKALEDQNLELLEKHGSLEDEYRKISNYKPLMEQYKNQIATLEEKNAKISRENENLKFNLERTEERLRIAEEEREKEGEAVQLFEERVKELESETVPKRRVPRTIDDVDADAEGGVRDSVLYLDGVGAELDDAVQGTTMTHLKLKIRKLEKDLVEARKNKADASRMVVLENLLEDANRMKSRYESDWLKEHRERLILQEKLDFISQGKSAAGDGPEATIALRQRLNETVEELEKVRRELTEVTVRFEYVDRELTVAKSNLNLVNKDQLDILSSLRDQVSVEKVALQKEFDKLKEEFKLVEDKNKMQMSQINNLLMEKVDLQSQGIGQRERMMERERELGNIKASLSGKGMSPADQKKFAEMELELKECKDTIKKQEKTLAQAKDFIRQQEKLWKKQAKGAEKGTFDQAEEVYQSEIAQLKDQITRLQETNDQIEKTYRQEVRLVTSAWHRMAIQSMRESIANGTSQRQQPKSWLAQQRERANGKLRG
ncbi:hypothetical protein BT69DRAFT_1282370 [Atractiella rhizophila]|nr:hypothetical protein BT69DRAFT_1282370 [Atractiella rhizophila]